VIAARVSSVIVGILAIYVGIAAEGQNVAHLVALAFAVAASSNLPAVFLTLYWKTLPTPTASSPAWWSAPSPPSAW
jgi:cation/acetate symporter